MLACGHHGAAKGCIYEISSDYLLGGGAHCVRCYDGVQRGIVGLFYSFDWPSSQDDRRSGQFSARYVTIGSVSTVDSMGAVKIVNDTPQTFDLLTLQTVDKVIGVASLPAGNYSQIRLTVTAASVVDNAGTTFNLKVPSGAQTGIKLVDNFTITNNQITSITLDFNADQSIVRTGNIHAAGGVQYLLKPVIQVVANVVSGQIAGKVLDSATAQPIAASSNALVTAYLAVRPPTVRCR